MWFEPPTLESRDESPNLFTTTLPEFAEPNCVGVAWSYHEAVAKTLEEMDLDIAEGLMWEGFPDDDTTMIKTTIKDGADGMGDISVHKGASDSYLPDKAFRASFAVLKCEAVTQDGSTVTLFEEEKPNAVQVNRPIMEAIGDINSSSTSAQLLRDIERERKLMHDHTMKMYTASLTRLHKLKIFNSMIDEKLDRADGGLQGSGSEYLCTLCHATRDTAKTELGTFRIEKTYQETADIGRYMKVNPDKLSQAELADISKGAENWRSQFSYQSPV
ncbi:V(D)J recombination-activating protein 1-like [Strongylocentrotus purpuratus]|uniref:Uncharacterized protein n=1 Tax=Strongylocentrotus purpuratus TaxID=7668 RepID=A0A7M7NT31_STRPU|nr:V(D)J recombination-activating protein 1-like [Strongylocentrotus purpuratus]